MEQNHPHTVAELIRSFQNHEEKGFTFFFMEYYAALSYFSFQMIKNKPAAEEIAGDTLLKLWDRHANFDNLPAIKSFLYTTARHASLNWIRQEKRIEKKLTGFKYLAEQNECTVMHQIIEAELNREIHQAIKTLPPKCRQIFQMLFLEGKEYKDIASELNLSVDTIRSQKARALMLIKQRMVLGLSVMVLLSQCL